MLTVNDLNEMRVAAEATTAALHILASEMESIDDLLVGPIHQHIIDLEETINRLSAVVASRR